jgi:hypothetical protein
MSGPECIPKPTNGGQTGGTLREYPCTAKNCSGVGTCHASKCTCPKGYSGAHCEKNPCYGKSCSNGVCKFAGATANCMCNAGYSGLQCETTPCSKVSCGVHGRCIVKGATGTCSCDNGYTGTSCEHDPCTNVNCGSHGRCVVRGSTGSCSCSNRYTGKRCENSPCSNVNCGSHGRCTPTTGSCVCTKGYSGSRCQYDPCQNADCGVGDCQVVGDHHKCTCWPQSFSEWVGGVRKHHVKTCKAGWCNPDGRSCKCQYGVFGSRCNQMCQRNVYHGKCCTFGLTQTGAQTRCVVGGGDCKGC